MKVMYFSLVGWNWIKQRPHFIAEGLAENIEKVDYISIFPIFKSKTHKKIIKKNFFVREFWVFPFSLKFKTIRILNKFLFNLKVDLNKYNAIILTHPIQIEYLREKSKKNCKIIYDCMDNIPEFYDRKIKDRIISFEKELLDIASEIIVSSATLKKILLKRYKIENKKISIINNAMVNIQIDKIKKIKLKQPNLVYIGTIDKWLDIEMLEKFSKNNPKYTIYLIGPNKLMTQRAFSKNMIFYGKINHEEVFSFIKSSDILLIPFIKNNLIEAVDPVKIYEYIGLNSNVLSTEWDEITKFGYENLKIYKDYETFEKIVKEFKIKSFNKKINKDFIDKNNWKKRIREYLKVLEME